MRILNKICQFSYEIAIIGALLLSILAPLHGHFTRHFTLTQTIDHSHAKIIGDLAEIKTGGEVDIYRFQYNWKPELGTALIESVSRNQAIISFNPEKMAWPVGLHGQITNDHDRFYLSVGSRLGVKEGDSFNIFKDRNYLGKTEVIQVEEERSVIGERAFFWQNNLNSLTASGYTVATQATYYDNRLFSLIEIALILGLFLAYSWIYFVKKTSPLILLGQFLKKIPIPGVSIFWLVNILAAVPFIWLMSKMPLHLTFFLLRNFFNVFLNSSSIIEKISPFLYLAIGIWYFYFLFKKRRSPILAFWRFVSYRSRDGQPNSSSFSRGLFLWALYLIIIYAFASVLVGFLKANFEAMKSIDPAVSAQSTFEYLKYGIWSLTIVGCLVGYGHSVISILWKKYVRNLDFTVQGWLTNGFCYPLFGVVIWQMIPSFTGLDPIVTDGPLHLLMLFLGLVLNILYMLSIWNLGTMFGVMADKGVRTWGFYSVVRHPSYTLEVLMFFVMELAGLTTGIHWLAISMYFFIYWIRSEREDNFMAYSNPQFTPYKEKTPYKFIPGIY